MKRICFVLAMLLASVAGLRADLTLASGGRTKYVILRDANATVPELHAVSELADTLHQITGAEFKIEEAGSSVPARAILVGRGVSTGKLFPDVPFDRLGPEEFVIKTRGDRLLLAGGRPRGTIYAVNRFLQDQCGVRWWTAWASQIPSQPRLRIRNVNVRAQPAFELRDPYWYPAFNHDWAVRNACNGQRAGIPDALGGSMIYADFVHTFYKLVPPGEHFAKHPEWFSLIKGERTTNQAQLCLTNPKLRDFVVERVRQRLRETPEARIISVSQNDWQGACECSDCQALDDAEGSHAGTMLSFVNYVAEKIRPEFPNVAIDTLAYQYTRKAPRTIKPLPNVIVRLCSIECNFREPLDHRSNAAFDRDLEDWSKICSRLYIWDYTTDFAHYVQPFPNWFVLGPNLRLLQSRGVRGVFEQGAYQSFGSEMAELRAWVLAQLLWNPQQNDRALITEFLRGYYGPVASLPIGRYLDLMQESSHGFYLTCYTSSGAPFLRFESLLRAEQFWRQAELGVADDSELLARVRLGHLPVLYAWLARWEDLQKECREAGKRWPLPKSQKQVAEEWLKLAQGVPGKPWTKVTLINEGEVTPEKFVQRFLQDPTASTKP